MLRRGSNLTWINLVNYLLWFRLEMHLPCLTLKLSPFLHLRGLHGNQARGLHGSQAKGLHGSQANHPVLIYWMSLTLNVESQSNMNIEYVNIKDVTGGENFSGAIVLVMWSCLIELLSKCRKSGCSANVLPDNMVATRNGKHLLLLVRLTNWLCLLS